MWFECRNCVCIYFSIIVFGIIYNFCCKISVDCTYTVLIKKFEIQSNFGRRVVLVRLILFGQRQRSTLWQGVHTRVLCIRWVHGCIPNSVHHIRHGHLPNVPENEPFLLKELIQAVLTPERTRISNNKVFKIIWNNMVVLFFGLGLNHSSNVTVFCLHINEVVGVILLLILIKLPSEKM